MDQLLSAYAEIIKGATDDQVVQHLSNLVQDAAALAAAIENVISQARGRVGQ